MSSTEDRLYSWLNPRGRKNFRSIERSQLAERFPEFARIGLPAHKAALEGNVEALRGIYAASTAEGVPSRDVNGATPLHLAVRGNRIEAVKWLLRFTDLSSTISAKHGETPCHVAAALGHVECLKVMVAADVKGEICVVIDNSGFTPLHLAIVKFRNEVAKLLISELGAKGMGPVSETGITAAHVAASSGNVEVLKIITGKNKKFLSQETADGTTPLYFAAQEGRLTAVQYLHEKGKCDLFTPSSDGRRPIHAACQCGHTHIVKYIVSQMSNNVIFDTVPDGATTLHFASSTGQWKTAKWLIDSDVGGKLVTSKDNNGDTPAHDAADNGKLETLRLLLESGADLYAVNSDGNTPYSLALSSQEPGLADFVMAFASNAPQKQEEGPSQMTIFDMQGEVDVVDLPSKEQTTVVVEAEVEVVASKTEEEEAQETPTTPEKATASAPGEKTPTNTPGKKSPTTAGKKSPTTAGKKSPTTAGKKSPTTAGKKSLTTAGKNTPTTAGKKSPTTAGKKSPTTAGKKSPTTAGKKAPTTPAKKSPTTPVKKSPTTAGKKEEKKKKEKEKEKKEKEKKHKDKKGKKNGSFLHSAGAALLAIPAEGSGEGVEKVTSDHKILDLTEEELDMFKEDPKPESSDAATKPVVSDDGEIVVSYGDQTPPPKSKVSRQPESISSQEYMTVNEMEKAEKKKNKKKMGRKNSKSIQKQKNEEESAKNVEGAGAILSGSQMGFKPQFRTNPLQRLGGAAPPTPPPTPATGFSSSAPSEAGMVSIEDEDDMPYDMYTQEVEVRKAAAGSKTSSSEDREEDSDQRAREITSEPSNTTDNVVTNLDDDEEEEEEEEEEEDKKPVLKKWPPPKVVDYKPAEAKLEPSGVSVLSKWQPPPKSDTKPASPPTSPDRKGSGNVRKKWPPAYSEPKPSPTESLPRPIKKTPSPLTVTSPPPVTLPPSPPLTQGTKDPPPVKDTPVEREEVKGQLKNEEEERETKLSKVKFKKASRAGANYSSPSSEATSGADNELSALLKIRQRKI